MLTKAETLAAITKELGIVAHLAGKLAPAHLAFRFTPPQRSTQELLEYLAISTEALISALLTGSWTLWETRAAEVKGTALDRFPALFAGQVTAVQALLAPFDEAAFASRRITNFQGVEMALPAALFDVIVQLASYKMQLFLQAKAAGVAQLASANLWRGQDPAAKAAH